MEKKNEQSYIARIHRAVRAVILKILRIRAAPEEISRGLALGAFVGCLPIIPLQTIVIIPLAMLFRASKLAGFIASFISNPLNMIPFYLMLWYIGCFFLPSSANMSLDIKHLTLHEIMNQGSAVFIRMMLGGVVLGIPVSLGIYYGSLPLVRKYQNKRIQTMLVKAQERRRREQLVGQVEHLPITEDDIKK